MDENFVVLLGKCSNTKKKYLIKYAKRIGKIPGLEQLDVKGIDYKLVGAYPIDDKAYEELSDGKSNRNINTMSLIGVPLVLVAAINLVSWFANVATLCAQTVKLPLVRGVEWKVL